MRKLIATLALATLVATPGLAASARHQSATPARAANADARAAFAQDRGAFAQDFGAVNRLERDPSTVVVNGRYIGRDPDPNIRFELRRDAEMSEY